MSGTLAVGWPGRTVRKGARQCLLAVATALILTALAPWHTGNLAWLERAMQFIAAAFFWEMAIMAVVHHLRQRLNATWSETPLGLAVAVIVASVPATAALVVVLFCAGSRPGQLPLFYVQSLLLGLVIAFARRGLRQGVDTRLEAVTETAGTVEADKAVSFLGRHASTLAGHRLRALQAEDHYLRIHTDGGSVLVLMRMRDATAELGDGAGWQPHRSFWLASDAGGHAMRRGQAWQIALDTGLTVPVSKSAAQAMRKAGYILKS